MGTGRGGLIRGGLGSEDLKHGTGAETTQILALETHQRVADFFNRKICLGKHHLNYGRAKSV